MTAGWILALLIAAQDDKVAAPSEKAQSEAEKTVRDVFKDEYAVKTSSAQQRLAKKLLQQGLDTKDDQALRFVVFREAADLASRSGDLETLLKAIDTLCTEYQVDGPAFKEEYLSKVEPGLTRPEDLKRLAEAYIKVVREAIDLDEFEVAAASAQSGAVAAKKSKDIALAVRADGLLKSVSEAKAAFDLVRKADAVLAATPDDPAANQIRGEYLCLTKDQWEKGLVFLSKGPNGALKTLAGKEAAGPAEGQPLVDLADGWWDVAEKEKSSLRRSRLIAHARMLYDRALPSLAGLARVKVEKRIAEADVSDAPPGVAATASRDGLVAWWKCDEGKGATASDASGLGNDGTLQKGMEWVPGRRGSALRFNGSTGYVSCKTANLPATNTPQTISWWQSFPRTGERLGNMIVLTDNAQKGGIQMASGKGIVAVFKLGGEKVMSIDLANQEAWNHLAYVFDGKQHALYLNGTLALTSFVVPQAVVPNKCELGRWWGSVGSGYFTGILDDIRIYNRALPEPDLRRLAKE